MEFGTLVSTHGVVIQPRADDLTAEVSSDKIVVTRPGGLVLSAGNGRSAPLLTSVTRAGHTSS